MRVTTGLTDSIVVTHDGGMTFQAILTINDNFRAFLRASDGTLYAGTINGALYVLPPGAQQFETSTGPHFRCFGQRPGTSRIYACGNYMLDGFSVGYSDDGAQTFQKLMSFPELLGPLTCPRFSRPVRPTGLGFRVSSASTDGGADAGTSRRDAGPSDAGAPLHRGGAGHSGCSAGDGGQLGLLGTSLRRGRHPSHAEARSQACAREASRRGLGAGGGLRSASGAVPEAFTGGPRGSVSPTSLRLPPDGSRMARAPLCTE